MDLNPALKFELGDAAQILAENFFLDFELMVVSGVLIVASTTAAEMRTRRRDAVRRRLHDLDGLGAREAGFFLGERRFDLFSGEDERDEDCFAASAVFLAG